MASAGTSRGWRRAPAVASAGTSRVGGSGASAAVAGLGTTGIGDGRAKGGVAGARLERQRSAAARSQIGALGWGQAGSDG